MDEGRAGAVEAKADAISGQIDEAEILGDAMSKAGMIEADGGGPGANNEEGLPFGPNAEGTAQDAAKDERDGRENDKGSDQSHTTAAEIENEDGELEEKRKGERG